VSRIVLPGQPLVEDETALRAWRDTDVGALVDACQDADIARWTSVPERYGETDARAFLLQRYDAILAGSSAPFAIVSSRDDQHLLGSVSLMYVEWEHARAEVGYWLARGARGHGHATRAVRVICSWGFRDLRLERIELLAASANAASQRVAERSGFVREALLRSYMKGKDGRHDMLAYGLLAADAAAAEG